MVGLAPLALNGGHEGGLLAADEGTRTQLDLQVKGKVGAENMSAQQAALLGLPDGYAQVLYRHRVFRPYIHIALVRADGIGGNGHSLYNAVGVALQDTAVHKGPRIALVRVAADIFLHLPPISTGKFPLQARGKTRTAPAPQSAGQNGFNHIVRGHIS